MIYHFQKELKENGPERQNAYMKGRANVLRMRKGH